MQVTSYENSVSLSATCIEELPEWFFRHQTTPPDEWRALVMSLKVTLYLTRKLHTIKVVDNETVWEHEEDNDDEEGRVWFHGHYTKINPYVGMDFEMFLCTTPRWGVNVTMFGMGDEQIHDDSPDLFERHVMNAMYMMSERV
jgi:hypothetical protein